MYRLATMQNVTERQTDRQMTVCCQYIADHTARSVYDRLKI